MDQRVNPRISKMRVSAVRLPRVRLDAAASNGPSSESGVAITTYGKGQVSGAIYTVPAHGEITLDFDVKLFCVTPDDVQTLSNLIRTLLDATHRSLYDDLQVTTISGGASFFGFFGWGGVSGGYSDTKHTMDSFGLSDANQATIIDAMMKVVQQTSDFQYKGTVHNKDYDYDVSGSLFAIVMDATIEQDQYQKQLRFIAPNVHLESPDGTQLPSVGPLYNLAN